MTCLTCRGVGHMLTVTAGGYEFWPCPACGGDGIRILYGPPTIHIHPWRARFAKNAERMRAVAGVAHAR